MITESINPRTSDIDNMPLQDAVALLSDINQEIFPGFTSHVMEDIFKISFNIRKRLYSDETIALFGSGTSGRIAVHTANHYNQLLNTDIFKAYIAGGYNALVKSKEGAEDDPSEGLIAAGLPKKGMFINISCSGKARSSLAALEHIVKNDDIVAANITFNNPAIKLRPDDINLSMKVGPEAITGSTRLKSGTATQMVLDMAIMHAILTSRSSASKYENMLDSLMKGYIDTTKLVDANIRQITTMTGHAIESLLNGGHLYYISHGILGRVALTDASECPPTFGASPDDVRAFTEGGWNCMLDEGQYSMTNKRFMKSYPISLKDYAALKTQPSDTIILIAKNSNWGRALWDESSNNRNIKGNIIMDKIMPQSYYQYSMMYEKAYLKQALNIITTAAYVSIGKTWKNMMIDLNISNSKLLGRAINNIIPYVMSDAKPGTEEIISNLNANTIHYYKQAFNEELALSSNPEDNIKYYSQVKKLVPHTILTLNGMDPADALTALGQDKHIRKIIDYALSDTQ